MSPAVRPWKSLTPTDRVEAVRPLEAEGQAASTIAWRLSAPQHDVAKICSLIRREREAGEEREIPAGSHVSAARLPEPIAETPAERTTGEGPEGGTTGHAQHRPPTPSTVASVADQPLPAPRAPAVSGGEPGTPSSDAGAGKNGERSPERAAEQAGHLNAKSEQAATLPPPHYQNRSQHA